MKDQSSRHLQLSTRVLTLVFVASAIHPQAHAAEKIWLDGAANSTWDTSATNTWADATAWNNDTPDSAVFGGPGEAITLGEAIFADSLVFNASGYILRGNTLTLDGGTRTIATNGNARIDSELSCTTENAYVRGAGTLTLGGRATFVGGQAAEGLYRYVPADSSGSIEIVEGADVYANSMTMMQDHANNCTITYNQTGGIVVIANEFGIGGSTVGGSSGGVNIANIRGGTLSTDTLFLYKWAESILNLSDAGVVNVNSLRIGWVDSSPFGTINLGDGIAFHGGTSIRDGGTSGILNVASWNVHNNRDYLLNFNGGTLQAGSDGASLAQSNAFTRIEVHQAGGVIDNAGYNISYAQAFEHGGSNAIDGGMAFKGSGSTTLHGNRYTGPTKVEAGTLIFTDSSSAAPIAIHSGAALACNGSLGDVSLANGARLEAGVAGTGNLTIDNLTIGGGAGSAATIVVPLATGATPISAQHVTLNGGNGSVALSAVGSPLVHGTEYEVMSYTSLSTPGASSPLAVFVSNSRSFTPVIDAANRKILLRFDANAGLDWTGIGSSEWSETAGRNNWRAGGSPADFVSGEFVRFGNAGNPVVQLSEDVAPGGITFENDAAHPYLVTGNFGITGSGSVTKNGAGKVTINTINRYTGHTTIHSGILQLGDASHNGALSPASMITNNGTLAIHNEFEDMVQGTDFSATITGNGSLLKSGAGTLTLNTGNSYTGGTVIRQGRVWLTDLDAAGTAGTITLGDDNTGDSDVMITISVVSNDYQNPISISNPITVTGPGTGAATIHQSENFSPLTGLLTLNRATVIEATAGDRVGIDGKITGNVGTLTFIGNRITLGQSLEDASDFLGNVVVDCQVQLNSIHALPPTASVTVNDGGYFRTIAGGKIDGLNGSGRIDNDSGRAPGDPVISSTLSVGNHDGSGEFSGVLKNGRANDEFAFAKNGSGTQILSGENSYGGSTTINAGTLQIDGFHSGTGEVTAKPAARLAGIGSINGEISIESGGFVAPGNSAIGTLTVAAATLAGTYQCQLDGGSSDTAAVAGLLAIESGAAIHISTLKAPTAASYTIATYGSLVGDLPEISGVPQGYAIDIATPGEIKLVSTATGGFHAWANSFPGLTDTSLDGDPDQDGIVNLLEYALGGDPRVPETGLLPIPIRSGSDLVLRYQRADGSQSDTTQTGQWSTDLENWTDIAAIRLQENGTAPDDMEIRIPIANAEAGRLYGRLRVSRP